MTYDEAVETVREVLTFVPRTDADISRALAALDIITAEVAIQKMQRERGWKRVEFLLAEVARLTAERDEE